MAAVRGLRVSVKAEAPLGPALGLPSPEVESGLERGEPEPMEVEEGELEIVPVRRSLKECTVRRFLSFFFFFGATGASHFQSRNSTV
jgi:hypothetical protein